MPSSQLTTSKWELNRTFLCPTLLLNNRWCHCHNITPSSQFRRVYINEPTQLLLILPQAKARKPAVNHPFHPNPLILVRNLNNNKTNSSQFLRTQASRNNNSRCLQLLPSLALSQPASIAMVLILWVAMDPIKYKWNSNSNNLNRFYSNLIWITHPFNNTLVMSKFSNINIFSSSTKFSRLSANRFRVKYLTKGCLHMDIHSRVAVLLMKQK